MDVPSIVAAVLLNLPGPCWGRGAGEGVPKGTRNTRLAALQQEAGWTNGDLAREVNRLGTLHGLRLAYDRTAVAHWLSGSRPRPPVPALVAEILSRRLGRLVTPEWAGLASPRQAASSSTAHPILALAEFAVTDADSDRRGRPARLFSVQEIEVELSGAAIRLRDPDSRRSSTAQRLEHLSSFSSNTSSATGADARQHLVTLHSR